MKTREKRAQRGLSPCEVNISSSAQLGCIQEPARGEVVNKPEGGGGGGAPIY